MSGVVSPGRAAPLSSIVYYITGHGYGHAVRSCQVVRALKEACPDIEIHIRTTAPKWLFRALPLQVSYHNYSIDIGILQQDSLEMNLEETLRACEKLHKGIPNLVDEEMTFIKKEKIGLIIGDIPPLCFEIAHQAAIPSVAVTNFTWDWIYRGYLRDFPSFLPLIQEMEGFYRRATLALSLPFSCDLGVFPNQVPIPLITRMSTLDKTEARKKYGLPASAQIVLISFGGFGLERLSWKRLKDLGEFFFVATGRVPKKEKNFVVLSEAQNQYEDLVRASDVVVSKPGYGIVADVIAHRVAILYTSRGDYPECPYLVEALKQRSTCEFIPQEELLAGNLGPYLRRLLQKEKNRPVVPLNGAQVAAEKILEILKRG